MTVGESIMKHTTYKSAQSHVTHTQTNKCTILLPQLRRLFTLPSSILALCRVPVPRQCRWCLPACRRGLATLQSLRHCAAKHFGRQRLLTHCAPPSRELGACALKEAPSLQSIVPSLRSIRVSRGAIFE